MIEEDLMELEGETITIINSNYHETVVNIGEIKFSERMGYYAKCIVANVSDWEWGIDTITMEIIENNRDDIDFADDDYIRMMINTIFEGEDGAQLHE